MIKKITNKYWFNLLKTGVLSGLFIGIIMNWLLVFINKFFCSGTNLPSIENFLCSFIGMLGLIFVMPVYILLTIVFGPLGERAPNLFYHGHDENKFIVTVMFTLFSFIAYLIVGILVKIIYDKIKNKKNSYKNNNL